MEMYYLVGKTPVKAKDIGDWTMNFRITSVQQSRIGEFHISTIFIGLDNRSLFTSDEDVPDVKLFETKVTYMNGNSGDYEIFTHSSNWEEAKKVHRLTCWYNFDMLSEED